MGCSEADPDSAAGQIAIAERFLDAFYAFDREGLTELVEPGKDAERAQYYQAWAEAAHYEIKQRRPCVIDEQGRVVCAITVTDDFGRTMGYEATDTFTMKINGGKIMAVTSEGDDPPIFDELFSWITANRPEILEGPCRDLFDGGTTPGACSRAVVEAARTFMDIRQS